ncbi:EamA family transporter [Hydrogenivirga sp.]
MKAVVFALLSALVWGTAPLIFKLGLRGDIPPLVGIFFHNLTAAAFALMSMLLLRESFSYPLRDVAIISLGGFVSGFLGLLLYYKAIKVGEVSVVAPIVASSPLWASLFAFILLGETLTPLKLVGTILVVTGVALITLSR